MITRRLLISLLPAAAAAGALAAAKPRVPHGIDPGGVAIAIVGSGIDYTRPDLARRLARDGEGEAIGWDLQAGDNKPFAVPNEPPAPGWSDSTPAIAALLAREPGYRIVPIRIDPANPRTLGESVAFAARTPARVLLMAVDGGPQPAWEQFIKAAAHFQEITIVVARDSASPLAVGAIKRPRPFFVVSGTGDGEADVTLPVHAPAGRAERLLWLLRSLPRCLAAPNMPVSNVHLSRLAAILPQSPASIACELQFH